MDRRKALKIIGSSIALTTSIAGCAQTEPNTKSNTTDSLNPGETSTPSDEAVYTEPPQEVSRSIDVAPRQGDKITHDSWSHEFREVDGEEEFVVSVTTRNPPEAEAGTLEYLYQFGFFHDGDDIEDSTDIDRTIPEDGEGLEPGESHEWELVFTENPQDLREYDVHIQPGGPESG